MGQAQWFCGLCLNPKVSVLNYKDRSIPEPKNIKSYSMKEIIILLNCIVPIIEQKQRQLQDEDR